MQKGNKEVLKNMGYRLWISKSELKSTRNSSSLKLIWENSGVAPLYKDWPAYIYIEDEKGKLVRKENIEIKCQSVLPGRRNINLNHTEDRETEQPSEKGISSFYGIEDPIQRKWVFVWQ